MKHSITALLLLLAGLFASCDDGRIPEAAVDFTEEGRVAKVDLDITGTTTWPSGYTVVVAGFADNNAYARVAMTVRPDANGHVSAKIPGISDDVKTLEVCVINTLRRRITTFWQIDAQANADTITVAPTQTINAGMYATIQNDVFTKQCANCHSGSAWAASLHLTEGHSYADLVNQESHKMPGHLRVKPGDASASVLYDILSTEESKEWGFDHSNIMASDENKLQLRLIRDWINNGAKE